MSNITKNAWPIGLRLWTGREVTVFLVEAEGGLSVCQPGRHCGHWTDSTHYQCCYCGATFQPLEADENLWRDATDRAYKRAPIDPATVTAWRAAAKGKDRRAEAARRLLSRLAKREEKKP